MMSKALNFALRAPFKIIWTNLRSQQMQLSTVIAITNNIPTIIKITEKDVIIESYTENANVTIMF